MTHASSTPDKARKASASIPIPGVQAGGVHKRRHSGAGAAKPVHSASVPKLQAPHTAPAGGASGKTKSRLKVAASAPGGVKPRFDVAGGARAVAKLSDALVSEYDPDDPAAFLLAQGFARPLVEQALRECDGDEDDAQVWIMQKHVAYQPPKGAARGPGAPGAPAVGLSAAELAEQKFLAEQEAQFMRDLHTAQVASELATEEEERQRKERFTADAKADPVGTFLGTSVFLREVMEGAGAAGPDDLAEHTPVLADLLLLEKYALKQWEKLSHPYFEEVARAFKAAEGGTQHRGELLARWVADIGDPRKPGSIYGMPIRGQGAGLPPALMVGPVEVDDEVIVLD